MLGVVSMQLVELTERATALPKGHLKNFSDFFPLVLFNIALIVYYYSVICF